MECWAVLSEGGASAVADTVQVVTGKRPRTFAQLAREHAVLFA